jgi:NifU-like protein involved in Fe-S cluster formation
MTTNDQMLKLYSQKILRLAADIPFTERLEEFDATAKKRSPLCGSTVSVDVVVIDGKISAFGQDVKACALGQASASIFGASVIGRTVFELETLRVQLWDMLANNGPIPEPPFEGYAALQPAQAYPNRHASILLCVDATLDAMASIT